MEDNLIEQVSKTGNEISVNTSILKEILAETRKNNEIYILLLNEAKKQNSLLEELKESGKLVSVGR